MLQAVGDFPLPRHDAFDILGKDGVVRPGVHQAELLRALSSACQLVAPLAILEHLPRDEKRGVGVRDVPLGAEQIVLARRHLHLVELLRHGAVLGEPTFRDQPAIRETELQRGLDRAAVNPGLPAGYDLGYQHCNLTMGSGPMVPP